MISRRCFLVQLIFAVLAVVTMASPVAAQRSARLPQGLDGRFLQLTTQLPGFGGYYFDANGDLNVYLTDVRNEPAARALLADVAVNRPQRWRQPWTRAAEIVIHHGQFDFAELDSIRQRLVNDIGGMSGIRLFDRDEVSNQVVVGVAGEEERQKVLARIASLNLPQNAINVDVVPEISYATSLRNSVRPVVGGLLIQYTVNSVTYDCTLGVNVLYGNTGQGIASGTPGFYTASHCSETEGQTNGTVYAQGAGGSRIGFEAYDAPLFNWRNNPDCVYQFDYISCRYSDVLFAAYDGGVNRKQGYLAKTLSKGVGPFNSGSIDLNMLGGWQFKNNGTVLPVVGMTLDKVGQYTGWTEGSVYQTCIDIPINNIYILCTNKVAAYAWDGDSGAPVFQLLGTNNDVAFSGIVWAKQASTGMFYYSDVNQIAKDMGTDVSYVP